MCKFLKQEFRIEPEMPEDDFSTRPISSSSLLEPSPSCLFLPFFLDVVPAAASREVRLAGLRLEELSLLEFPPPPSPSPPPRLFRVRTMLMKCLRHPALVPVLSVLCKESKD